jgi:hypothetical protein
MLIQSITWCIIIPVILSSTLNNVHTVKDVIYTFT